MAGEFSSAAVAQSQYDVIRFYGIMRLNGTARFVGMGGAMGALGADLSTMSTNPAGIGIVSEQQCCTDVLALMPTIRIADLGGIVSKREKPSPSASFDQIGFVWSNLKSGIRPICVYVNFGFNYRKRANFNRQFLHRAGGFSERGFAALADGGHALAGRRWCGPLL